MLDIKTNIKDKHMILYEVNLTISPAIYEDYCHYLEDHLKEMLEFAGFKKALILNQIRNSQDNPQITVHYYIENLIALDHYLKHHATKMRNKSLKQFPNQFTATRRIFELNDDSINTSSF